MNDLEHDIIEIIHQLERIKDRTDSMISWESPIMVRYLPQIQAGVETARVRLEEALEIN